MEAGARTFRVVTGDAPELLVALIAFRRGDDVTAGGRGRLSARGDEIIDHVERLGEWHAWIAADFHGIGRVAARARRVAGELDRHAVHKT
jgi:hypothetical protein